VIQKNDSGEVTAYEWNAQHNLTATIWPDGSRKQYHYEDPRFGGYLTGITDELGTRISRYEYTQPGEVARTVNALGQTRTSFTYQTQVGTNGLQQSKTTIFEAIGTGPIDAMGYGYNANAQLARIVQLQNGTETARWTLGYNDQGDVQRITHTDATTATETTQRIPQHDAHGRPEVIVHPDGSRTRLIYNQRGALTRLVQGEQITHFTYDARGVMTRIKTPDGSVFALVYDSDVNLTQVRHNGKAITAAYVAGLSGEVKATVAEIAVAFSWVFTDEVLTALTTEAQTTSTTVREQGQRAQREKPQAIPLVIPAWSWATGVAWAGATGTGAWIGWNLLGPMLSSPPDESKPIVRPPEITYPENCSDLCKKRIVDASNRYWKLTQKRMTQYQTGGTHGRDPGHANAVLELQRGLRKAISAVRHHCSVLPPQLPEWERAANEPLPE
jgi:YD repeat-containing protein